MKKYLVLLVLIGVLTSAVAACGATPEPTVPPPTQTPWIIVVTTTPGPESVSQAQPTQTPWIIVVTPTQTKQATATATASATVRPATTAKPTQTSVPPTAQGQGPAPTKAVTPTKPPAPTHTATPGAPKYPAPVLLEPPTETVVTWKSTPVLTWTPVGELAEDEYYCIQFDRTPKTPAEVPWGDWEYTKDPSYVFKGAFKKAFHLPEEQGQATVYWWVRVVRKTGADENGKPEGVDISPPSEKWILFLEAKPRDA